MSWEYGLRCCSRHRAASPEERPLQVQLECGGLGGFPREMKMAPGYPGGAVPSVEVTMHILSIAQLNTATNTFYADFEVALDWLDSGGARPRRHTNHLHLRRKRTPWNGGVTVALLWPRKRIPRKGGYRFARRRASACHPGTATQPERF